MTDNCNYGIENKLHSEAISQQPNALKAGLLGRLVCYPDDIGEYRPYREGFEMAWDPSEGEWVTDYYYVEKDCPRFQRCAECPQLTLTAEDSILSGESKTKLREVIFNGEFRAADDGAVGNHPDLEA